MITFTILLLIPFLMSHPLLLKSGILLIIVLLTILGLLVNLKTDRLYINEFTLQNKSWEMEKLNRELISLNHALQARTKELIKVNRYNKKPGIRILRRPFRFSGCPLPTYKSILIVR